MTSLGICTPLLIILICAVTCSAQVEADLTAGPEFAVPRITTKVDEFGRVGECELGARLDILLFHLLTKDPDAKAYVISYAPVSILPSQIGRNAMLERIRRYTPLRGFDATRVVLIDGGYRKEAFTELYFVPRGGVAPKASDSLPTPTIPNTTYLWSTRWLGGEESGTDTEQFVREDVRRRLENEDLLQTIEAAEAARQAGDTELAETILNPPFDEELPEPDDLTPEEREELRFDWVDEPFAKKVVETKQAHGVIIFYADDEHYDISALRKFIEQGRDRLIKSVKLKPTDLKIVFGGYRDYIEIEYFVVPKNGKPPKPTPSERQVEDD